MYRNSLRGALLASTAFVVLGSGSALAQAGGSCTTVDGAQVCEGDQPTVNAYGFGLESFTNSGTLNSTWLYLYNNSTPFAFLNTGTGMIITTGYGIPSVSIEGSNPGGVLDVESFVNQGVIASTVGAAVFTASAVDIGSFENSGIIAAVGEGHTPGGCFFAEDYAVEIQGRVTGDFTNTGAIGATDTAVHVAAIDGDFINEGEILVIGGEAFGDTAVRIGSLGGDFINGADASIFGYTDAVDVDEIGGDFINYGLILGVVEAYEIGSLDGDFLNYGTIGSTADHGYGAGWIGYLGGNYLNAAGGQIVSEDYGLVVSTMGGASFTNDGLISSVYDAVQIGYPASNYTFTNTGDILASNGSGVILGAGGGPGAEGQDGGVLYSHDSAAVTFSNTGNIVAAETGVLTYGRIASLDNSGLIDGGYIGVNLGGSVEAFLNTGDIIGGYAGVTLGYLYGDFVNEGLIDATRGYTSGRQAPKSADSIPNISNGVGVIASYISGDFINLGDIRGARAGVSIYELDGDFINEGLIETTAVPNTNAVHNSGGEYSGYYAGYALEIQNLGGGAGMPFNSGVGSAIGADDLSFINTETGRIIGTESGLRIRDMMGPGFYNGGLISSTLDAVTIDRGGNDYVFLNYGDILSSDGVGVSLGNYLPTPAAEPLGSIAAPGGVDYIYVAEVDFFNGGNIIAGRTGVDIGNDVFLFTNEGLISGSDYGVRLTGSVFGFINLGTITASGGTAPEPPQRPLAQSGTLVGPALSSMALGDGVSLDYVLGGFVNGPDASITGTGRGVNAFVVGNIFGNLGTISGGYQGVSMFGLLGDFVNEGLIEQTGFYENSDAAAISIYHLDGATGFINGAEGAILSQADGVVIYDFVGGNFVNDGEISSIGDAVNVNFVGGERSFENNGDIYSNAGTGVVLTISPAGGCGIAPLGADSSPCASDLPGADLAFTELTFLNTGNIFGDQAGVSIDRNVSFFTNSGRIIGATGAGIAISGDNGVVLNNLAGGEISGFTGIMLTDGVDVVDNAGIITGTGGVAIDLAAGNDIMINRAPGVVTGMIDGGSGYDFFSAVGSQTLDMAIVNFEEIWAYEGDISFGRDQAAALMVSRGDSLDLADFTFTGALLSFTDLFGNGATIDGDVLNFGSILGLDTTITGNLYNGGVINPGGTGAIGVLTVLGDYFALNIGDSVTLPGTDTGAPGEAADFISPSGSTLVFNFSGLNHDQIIVTGTATLGGDLIVTGDLSEAMKARQGFTLVSAASISGAYNLLNIGGVLFTPEVDTVGANVLLSFAQNNFVASLAPQTVNQTQAALGLEDRWTLGASAADDIVIALNAGAASAPILEAFAPETSAVLTRQSARIGTQLAQTVANCAIGPNAGACGRRESEGGLMIWTNVSGSEASLKADGNAAGVDEAFSQVSSGAELAFNDRFTGGVFLASGTGDVDVADGQRGHGEIDSVAGGVYARFQAGRFTLAGLAGYADTDIEARRHTPSGSSIGETGGSVSFARLDARLTLVSGVSQAGFAMSGTYAYAEMGSFAQRGAGGYDLDIVGDSFRVEDWELRGFFGHDFEPTQSGYIVSFGGTAGVVHANGEDTASAGASFPGASDVFEGLGPRSNDTGGVAGGFINLASPLAGVIAQIGVEGRWMEGEDSSRVYGRFAWTF